MKKNNIKLIALILAIGIPLSACRYKKDLQDTVFSEFKASELNRKYEWFKDTHSRLSSLKAQIENKEAQISSMKASYEGVPRNQWSRFDIQNLSIFEQEMLGIKGSFNNLAAEYNSEMSKFHTSFANTGVMPAGSDLPTQVISYK